MQTVYVIRTPRGLLGGFYPNGLPVGKKLEYVEKYRKFFPIFRPSELFLQTDGFFTFETEDEATNYLTYVRREIHANAARYDEVRPESGKRLLCYIAKFKVAKRQFN